jgi:RNA exonuclease 1
MVLTTKGHQLARVSLVDENENVLLDEYCLPEAPIVDYLTQYSGITKETLLNVKNSVFDVRKLFLDFVSSDTIVVGHSLENDFIALKVFHYKVIDTSILYPHNSGTSLYIFFFLYFIFFFFYFIFFIPFFLFF